MFFPATFPCNENLIYSKRRVKSVFQILKGLSYFRKRFLKYCFDENEKLYLVFTRIEPSGREIQNIKFRIRKPNLFGNYIDM